MTTAKFYFQFAIVAYFLIFGIRGNDFFKCLEKSEFSNFRHCSFYINKVDRLPHQIKPTQYRLIIQPFIHLSDTKKFHFIGSVYIEFQSEISHRHLMIHAGRNLQLKSASIKIIDGHNKNIAIESIHYVPSRQWFVMKMAKVLPANKKHYIRIKGYTSKFSKINGFYSFSYTINKIKKFGANILFSPFYARNVFPCFDDPIFETQIQFNLIRKEDFVSQSIMTIKKTVKLKNKWSVDIYKPTPKMQMYQFSFSVNKFSYISKITSTGHLIKIWAPKEKLHLCEFGLDKIKTALEFYEKYFNSRYVFDKLDVVVTMKMPPYETGSSTYGLLIILDSIVIIDEDKTLPRMKQIYVNTINHEIAHQWIGNTLRMEWFDGLWMIEGLVGYMEQKIKTHQTQYDHRLATALTQTLTGLFADDTELNHKMAIYPYTTKQIEFYFDDLIFTKGFSLFKMIEGAVGERNFQYALAKIVNNENIKPMKGNQLWQHIDNALEEKELSVSVEYIMDHWQNKRGFPIVQAKIVGNNKLVLSQSGNLESNNHLIWPIPITYLIKNGEERSDHSSIIWLTSKKRTIKLDNKISEEDWFVVNQDQVGFYRVNYEYSNWILLINQLRINHTLIPSIARLQLFDDIFQFYCNGEIPGADTIFDVISYLEYEKEYTIWKYSKFIINLLYSLFSERDSNKYFQTFMNKLISDLMRKIHWTKHNSLTLTIQMRDKLIFMYACRFENKYCDDRTEEFFDTWLDDYYFSAPLYLYGPLICNGIRRGDREVWYQVLRSLNNSKFSDDQKLTISESLACSTDELILSKYWKMMLTNKKKYKNLYTALLSNLAKNVHARPIFRKHLCSSSVNITKNPFEFAATLAALNNFILPSDCVAVNQMRAVRLKRSTGDNFEMESSFSTDQTRKSLMSKHIVSLEKWLKNNINDI